MNEARARGQYLETKVMTASPVALVLMLYDGELRFLRQMKQCLEVKDAAGAAEAQTRALAIVQELIGTLNPDVGEISVNLLRLYEFCLTTTLQAALRESPAILDGPLGVFATLREAWQQIEGKKYAAVTASAGALAVEA